MQLSRNVLQEHDTKNRKQSQGIFKSLISAFFLIVFIIFMTAPPAIRIGRGSHPSVWEAWSRDDTKPRPSVLISSTDSFRICLLRLSTQQILLPFSGHWFFDGILGRSIHVHSTTKSIVVSLAIFIISFKQAIQSGNNNIKSSKTNTTNLTIDLLSGSALRAQFSQQSSFFH